ncbi:MULTISPECIES: hypothetical protein [Flavobacterium]|uniref:hypothetical protein n=1 Tax=Flavobacterium TaxID=237 RepID=UPI001FCC5CF9|nr:MULTISPECIES: hypothetical protein [Flavobacterium]UOK43657.1 hypothetical protein LZF87_05940 [Flavobacterium enshiense]
MKKYILILLLIPILAFSQKKKSNDELIDNVKTKKQAEIIEKEIIGIWLYKKWTDKTGTEITSREIQIDTIVAIETFVRADIEFKNDGTYKFLNCPFDNGCQNGKWKYNRTEKKINFIFDKPVYNVPIDKIEPELLEQLKKEGVLIATKGFEWEIAEINPNELQIIEHLPHNEFEFDYELSHYIKK